MVLAAAGCGAKDIQLQGEWVGTTVGMVDATIRPKIQGYLLSQEYEDDAEVERGELLFRIDPRQFQAALDSARGQLRVQQAILGKAELDVKRFKPLAERGAVSQRELDDAVQAREAGRASVAAAKADVEEAQLNLEWTKIHSPLDGVAGIATIQVGDLAQAQLGQLLAVVDLYRVLGGGWKVDEEDWMAGEYLPDQPTESED